MLLGTKLPTCVLEFSRSVHGTRAARAPFQKLTAQAYLKPFHLPTTQTPPSHPEHADLVQAVSLIGATAEKINSFVGQSESANAIFDLLSGMRVCFAAAPFCNGYYRMGLATSLAFWRLVSFLLASRAFQ